MTARHVTLVVEGLSDQAVITRLLDDHGIGLVAVYGLRGKQYIDRRLSAFNEASKYGDWLVVRDLDRDAPCAPGDGGERLFVYGKASGQALLGVGDLSSFVLSEVGVVTPAPSAFPLEVSADAFGRLFGLSGGGLFVQIDPATAEILTEDFTSFSTFGLSPWALLTYNADIYFFWGDAAYQYDPATKKVRTVGNVEVNVVGASAAPCLHN